MAIDNAREQVGRLSNRGLGFGDYSRSLARILRKAIDFDGFCVMTMDPATLLPTGHVIENGLPDEVTPRLAEIEAQEPDFNKFIDLARRPDHVAALSEATRGELDRSRRHRELRGPNGFGDELRATLVSDAASWGGIVLMKGEGARPFEHVDLEVLRAISRLAAEGLRRVVLLSALDGAQEGETGPGLLVLSDDGSIAMSNSIALGWLDDLRDDPGGGDDQLPFVVSTVADQARGIAAGALDGGSVAAARVRTSSGRWLLVRGTMIGDEEDPQVAVVLEAAGAPELAPLIAEAYGLTERERAITQLIAQGYPTREISKRLHLSAWTVQDHLKSIFEKVGVRTRGELVARLFFEYYAPRLASGAPVGSDGWFAGS